MEANKHLKFNIICKHIKKIIYRHFKCVNIYIYKCMKMLYNDSNH